MLVPRRTLLPTPRSASGFDRLFEDLFDGFPFHTTVCGNGQSIYPAVNTYEDEKGYHVEADIPGIDEKDLEVTVLGNELRIAGTREESSENQDKTYHRRERHVGKFERVIRFPVDIDDGEVDAKFRNGVVSITLPKAAAALPRKVKVKGA